MEKLSKNYLIELRTRNQSNRIIKTLINTIIGELDRVTQKIKLLR